VAAILMLWWKLRVCMDVRKMGAELEDNNDLLK